MADNDRSILDDHIAQTPATEGAIPSSLVGTTISGRYRVIEALASGAMGAVYRGEHVHMRKRVAIKVLLPEAEKLSELVARFEREAIVGAHVDHPNIASATDFGQLDDGSYFLVLEFVRGVTLKQVIKQGPLSPRRATHIGMQIASALSSAHERGVVHRDLKPANIMLVEGERDLIKLIDFGFAKVDVERLSTFERTSQPPRAARPLTGVGMVVGTVAYLSPEARFGMDSVDARSDLYALGIILYEMLLGERPFSSDDPAEMLRLHALAPPPPLRERRPEVPATLEAIVMNLLRKDPAERMQTAAEVAQALERVLRSLDQEPEQPTPAPTSLRTMTFAGPSIPPRTSSQLPSLPGPVLPSLHIPAPLVPRGIGEPESPSPPPPARRPARVAALIGVAGVLLASVAGAGFLLTRPKAPQALVEAGAPSSPPPPAASAPSAPPAPSVTAPAGPSAQAIGAEPSGAAATTPAPSLAPAASSAAPAASPPGDSGRQRSELLSSVKARDFAKAASLIGELALADPAAFRDPQLVSAAAMALGSLESGKRPEAADLYEKLATQSGAGGPDVLYALATGSRGIAGVRSGVLLRRPDVRAKASPALVAALTLRETPCSRKIDALPRIGADGDDRALADLEALRTTECRRKKGCCLKDTPALGQAIGDIQGRAAK